MARFKKAKKSKKVMKKKGKVAPMPMDEQDMNPVQMQQMMKQKKMVMK